MPSGPPLVLDQKVRMLAVGDPAIDAASSHILHGIEALFIFLGLSRHR
jgi:hypothetical protein